MDTPTPTHPFTLLHLIATGSQSQVWLAEGPEEQVALKIARTPQAVDALHREAKILERTEHPGLVSLIDADDSYEWIALALANGKPLHEWCVGKSVSEILDVFISLCDILEYLHGANVFHGDLKPSNILVDSEGRPTLLDLGLAAKPAERHKSFRGTLGFAAPELLRGERFTIRTEIYGLGATLYACLTGRPPFVAPDAAALTYLPLVSLPSPPSSTNTEVSALLNKLVLTMLARAPSRRIKRLSKVRETLARSKDSRKGRCVFGMNEQREVLRRAVVAVCDHEARVVIVYGPPGCGRRTLISEAVEAGIREGLTFIKGFDPREGSEALKGHASAAMVVLREEQLGAFDLVHEVLQSFVPCLILLHAVYPIPSLGQSGAVLVTPAPLNRSESEMLVKHLGADASNSEIWWRESFGFPISLLGRVQAWKKAHDLPVGQKLPAPSEVILATLRCGPANLGTLSELLEMGQHTLLDHCEVLFASGLVECRDNGNTLFAVREQETDPELLLPDDFLEDASLDE